jgi:hypothetical protein
MDMNVEKSSRQPSPLQIMRDQTQSENVEYFNYLGSGILNGARCIWEIKSRTTTAKVAFNRKTFFSSKLNLNLRRKLLKCHIWGTALCGAENWTV